MPVFDRERSKIKMVALTQHGFENVVWYSPINQNRRRSEVIIRAMLMRYRRFWAMTVTNVIQFYENGIKIDQYRIGK